MKTLGKTFQWMIGLVMLAGIGVGVGVYYLWIKSDDLLRQQLMEKFAQVAPDLDIEIGYCNFDFRRRVRIKDLSIKPRGQSAAILTFREIQLSVDSDALADRQQIDIQKVRLINPKLTLARGADGRWNWESLPKLPMLNTSLPEVLIEKGTVVISQQRVAGQRPVTSVVSNVNLRLVPSGKRQFLIEGDTELDRAGTLKLNGRWNVDSKTGTINGSMTKLVVDSNLVNAAATLVPPIGDKLAGVQAKLIEKMALPVNPTNPLPFDLPRLSELKRLDGRPTNSKLLSIASRVAVPVGASSLLGGSALGLEATVNVNFRYNRTHADGDGDYNVLVSVLKGEITNPILPFRLHDLAGTLYCDNQQFIVRDLSMKNGPTEFHVDGKLERQSDPSLGRFDVSVRNLALDERLRSRLSVGFGRIYDKHQPTGFVDVQVSLTNAAQGKWKYERLLATAKRATAAHRVFPYRVQNINGTIRQRENVLDFDLLGYAGQRPIRLKGFVENPGPVAHMEFHVHVEGLPIDQTFRDACPPELKQSLAIMNLQGTTDAHVRFIRPAGLSQSFRMESLAYLKNGSVFYDEFPYRIDQLTGKIAYADRVWTFSELRGQHGSARITGTGSFSKRATAGELELTIQADDVPVDESLRFALQPALKRTWDDFSPTGTINVSTDIKWITDRPALVSIPHVDWSDGTALMKQLPYAIEKIDAKFGYARDVLTIKSFAGRHGKTRIQANGFGKFTDRGDWRVRLVELDVDQLTSNREFLRAMPDGLREVCDCLDPDHAISLFGMVELRGTEQPTDPVTAAWDLKTEFSGGTIAAGLDYNDVVGSVAARGTWDGRDVDMTGRVDLASVTVLDYRIDDVHGPFTVKNGTLTIGAEDEFLPIQPGRTRKLVAASQHVTGKAIGGTLTVDAISSLTDEPDYRVRVNMSHAKLEEYAKQYMKGENNIRGIINGWIDLRGQGPSPKDLKGRGQLQISPAALYELPIVVQMFRVLSLGPPDKTAFNYALFDFNVANSQFGFNSIDMVGNSIRMRGRGTTGFDGRVSLDFYSMLPRTKLPIPFINPLIGAASAGWVGVELRGTVDKPIARIKPLQNLDGALKGFLNSLPPLLPPITAQPNAIPRMTPARPRRIGNKR